MNLPVTAHARPARLKSAPQLLCLLVALTCSSSVIADTVWMKNGDRLTGTIRSLDSGMLLLSSSYGGDIRIKFDEIETLASAEELILSDDTVGAQYRAKLVRADTGDVGLAGTRVRTDDPPAQVVAPVPLAAVDRVTRPRPFLEGTTFKGSLDLGLNSKRASTETRDYSLAARGEARRGLWRHQAGAHYDRSKENNVVGTDNYGVDYTLDRFFTQQAFWQGRLSHQRDWVEDLSRQTAYGTGPGYQFWDNDLGAFSMSALLGRVHYGYRDSDEESFNAASLRWDYVRYFRAKQIELFARGEVMRPLGDAADFSLNTELGGRYNLTDWASIYLKYSRNQVSGARQSLNEKILSSGVGVTW